MKIRHLTYFIMLNFINQRAYFQRISYNFNEVLVEGIAEICVTESTPEKLVLRLHCHMCDLVSGKLTKNYLYYTYVRR